MKSTTPSDQKLAVFAGRCSTCFTIIMALFLLIFSIGENSPYSPGWQCSLYLPRILPAALISLLGCFIRKIRPWCMLAACLLLISHLILYLHWWPLLIGEIILFFAAFLLEILHGKKLSVAQDQERCRENLPPAR